MKQVNWIELSSLMNVITSTSASGSIPSIALIAFLDVSSDGLLMYD
jgi:hypothetical protein